MSALSDAVRTPFYYYRVWFPAKWQIDLLVPLVIAIGGALLLVASSVPVFGEDTLLMDLFSHTGATLSGFFIAGLAAVATLAKPGLDSLVDRKHLALIEKDKKGNPKLTSITLRRFLCILFGYLITLSLVSPIVYSIVNAAATDSGILDIASEKLSKAMNFCIFTVFLFLVLQVVVCTLVGVYFLAYRLHLPLPRSED